MQFNLARNTHAVSGGGFAAATEDFSGGSSDELEDTDGFEGEASTMRLGAKSGSIGGKSAKSQWRLESGGIFQPNSLSMVLSL